MQKRGLSTITIISIILVIGIVMTLGVFLIPFNGDSDETESEQEEGEEVIGEQAEEIIVEETTEEETREPETTEENQTETNETEEGILDVSAHSLVIENDGCPEGSNATCSIFIKATVKNTGTQTVKETFRMHLFESTNEGFILIETFTINEDFLSGAEKEFTETYKNLTAKNYFIQFRVDAVFNLDEVDESNNILNELVKVF